MSQYRKCQFSKRFSKHMPNPKTKPYTKTLKETMHRKSEILSKAQALWEVGMTETAQPLWLTAANYEEHIAPILDALGSELEGAMHRISAASCCHSTHTLKRGACAS